MLSGFFGPEIFGVYTLAITIVTLVKMFAPLGTELGTVYFGARYRQNDEQEKLKGLVFSSVFISTLNALLCSIIIWFAAPFLMDDTRALKAAIPAILLWTPLHTLVGLLRAQKDMKGNAVVYQLFLPICLLIGMSLIVALNMDLYSALIAYCFSFSLTLVFGIKWSWKHYGKLITDTNIKPSYNIVELLQYSIPMAFSQLVFRLNAWMDILMLGWLVTALDVGVYRIAVSLVMICGLPINAIITIFNPIIVELVNSNNLGKLNQLLKLVTKWLMLFTLPVLLTLYALPDVVLMIFDSAYLPSQAPLQILIMGQLVWASCSLCMRVIPMSGYALLNLCNGIVAALVNISLNYWLIPKYGTLGAAMATSITLATWSFWRLGEAWFLLRCFPFTKHTLSMFFVAVPIGYFLQSLDGAVNMFWRITIVLPVVAAFAFTSWYLGKQQEDEQIIAAVKRKLNRLTFSK
jgi:O-antigen/teichoic acid export membrane protein